MSGERRGGQVGEPLLERRRARDVVRVVVREPQRARVRGRSGPRAGRRTRSCRRRPPAPRRSCAGVLPGAIRSAPLWPIACLSALASRAPERRAVVVPLAARLDQGAAARARAAGPAVDRLEAVLEAVDGGRLHPRARLVDDRQRLLVGDVAGRPPRVDPAAKQPSIFHRFPIPAIVRWSSSASPIGRVGSSSRRRRRNFALVELAGEDVRAEAGDPLVQPGARVGHQLQHRAR